jgi:hypothetical protein
MSYRARAAGLLALLCAARLAAAIQAPRPQPSPAPRPPVRVYTNEDLERVHPFAAETGASSIPAFAAGEPASASAPRQPETRGRGEAYWRQQAAAGRDRLRALEERAAGLRARIAERIAERSRQPEVFGRRRASSAAASGTATLQASLAALERRMRRMQDDLEERARRDGALPGWLR